MLRHDPNVRFISGDDEDAAPPPLSPEAETEAASDWLKSREAGEDVPSWEDWRTDAELEADGRDERPAFRGVDDAIEEYQSRQDEDARQREADRQAEAEAKEAERQAEERAKVEFSQDDQSAVAAHVERQRQFQQDMAQYQAALAQAQANPDKLTTADRQLLAQAEDRLRGEAEAIQQGNSFLQTEVAKRQALSAKNGMLQALPELKDEGLANDFVKWAAKKHGVSEARVRAETNADAIGREFRAFEAEQREARDARINRPRKPLYSGGELSRAGRMPDQMTVAEAKERLRRTGGEMDAMNVLTLSRERAQDRG